MTYIHADVPKSTAQLDPLPNNQLDQGFSVSYSQLAASGITWIPLMLILAVGQVRRMRAMAENALYYGDNLTIMQQEIEKDSIDLIYIDPPFSSKRNYNLMYKTLTGMPVPEQVEAFCDTWELDAEKEQRAREMPILMREHGVDNHYVDFWHIWVNALRDTQPHLLAYLIYMVERLLHMRVLLRRSGSIYLHC